MNRDGFRDKRSKGRNRKNKKGSKNDSVSKNEELFKPINLNIEYTPINRLNIEFSSSLTETDQQKFLETNNIKLLGENIPPIAGTFEELNLPPDIMNVIKENGWNSPTPIQSISIPIGLKGIDMVGIANTGSGKTAAFLIPAFLHILQQPPINEKDGPIVIILSPTRELALQTDEVASQFCSKLNLTHACLFGGEDRSKQIKLLKQNPSIVTATPGRLIDFLNNSLFNPNRANFIVLDEADRMLDMGFEPQIRAIFSALNDDRVTFMFSATWPQSIRQLAADFQKDAVHVHIGNTGSQGSDLSTNERIKQEVIKLNEHEKGEKCVEILKMHEGKKVIVFAKTKRTVQQLSEFLRSKQIRNLSLHGDKSQNERLVALSKFKNSRTGSVLVATDVAARGLDVTDIDVVVNYDFPGIIEDYVHRIGRTARGEKSGTAVTFFTEDNRFLASDLARVITNAGQTPPDWLSAMAANVTKEDTKTNKNEKYFYNPREYRGFGSDPINATFTFAKSDPYGSFGYGYGGPQSVPYRNIPFY